MAFVGADVVELRQLADLFSQKSGELTGDVITTISDRLAGNPWQGLDRQQFDHHWNQQLVHLIRKVASALDDAAETLRKNAGDQENASSNSTAIGSGLANAATKIGDPPSAGVRSQGAPSTGQPTSPGGDFDPNMANDQYAGRTAGNFTNTYFAPGGEGDGQCTSWVNFRRKQLGLEAPIAWNSGYTSFYSGPVSSEPSIGAVGSSPGHTFIVESVDTSSVPRQISISEMNYGNYVNKAEFITDKLGIVSTAVLEEASPGVWRRLPSGQQVTVNFGQ